jgi:transposase-like protein
MGRDYNQGKMKNYVLLLPQWLQNVCSSEIKSLRYLKLLRFPGSKVVCPQCNQDLPKVFKVHPGQKVSPKNDLSRRINRYWCPNCHYRFYDFSGTVLASNKLPWSKVICAVNLFGLGKTSRQSALILKVNYKSIQTLFRKIRLAIAKYHHPGSSKREMMYHSRRRRLYLRQGFGRYLKGKLERYRHIAPANRLFYLLEQEYRYKNRNSQTLLQDLIWYLVRTD